MKKTTCLLLATFLLLLLSCSTESNNQPQGKRIGTWMAYPNKAYWKGSDQTPQMASRAFMAKTESDSIKHITNPDGQYITITKLNSWHGKEAFQLLVVDSTLSVSPQEVKDSVVYNKYAHIKVGEHIQGAGGVLPENFYHVKHDNTFKMMKLKRDLMYDCSKQSSNISAKMIFKLITYHYHAHSPFFTDSIVTKHIFNISGLRPTLDYMLCQ